MCVYACVCVCVCEIVAAILVSAEICWHESAFLTRAVGLKCRQKNAAILFFSLFEFA